MEIFAQAGAIGDTLPKALRNAGELGIGLQVWLQPCRDALMVTLAQLPPAAGDWKEFTLDHLRGCWTDQYGYLIPSDRIPDSRPLARPMPLYELLERTRQYLSGRILLDAGDDDYAQAVAETQEHSGIPRDRIVYRATNLDSAVRATQLDFPAVFIPSELFWGDGEINQWAKLHNLSHGTPLHIGCKCNRLPSELAMSIHAWELFVFTPYLSRQEFKTLKDNPRVEAVICPDPVLALMA